VPLTAAACKLIDAVVGRCSLTLLLRAPGLTPRGFQRLNRKYDGMLSSFAFNCNLRPYPVVDLISEDINTF